MPGIQQNVGCVKESHVRMTFSNYSNFDDMTNSMNEIPEVGGQRPDWRVRLHLYRCGETVAHAIL